MNSSPFDHRPDRQIGRVLREALSARDDSAFAKRVMAAAEPIFGQVPAGQWWTVLTEWARPGLAAALGLVAAAVLWFTGIAQPSNGTMDISDPLVAASEQLAVPALLADTPAPNVDAVLAAAWGN